MTKTRILSALTLTLALSAGAGWAQGGAMGAGLMEQWGLDTDGQITLQKARAKRGEVFYMFDVEGDGELTSADWAGVAEHMANEQATKGQGHGAGGGAGNPNAPGVVMHAAMTPEFNDTNGDGKVTLAEFEAATDRMFTALDRNGDHLVNPADFGR